MNYKNSRDLAWHLLIKHKVRSLPVCLSEICRAERIRLVTYQDADKLIRRLKLEGNTIGNDAFSIGRFIAYDDRCAVARQRFSIAHELGHIFLHSTKLPTVYNREPTPNDDPIEAEANVFASRLLAPLCVLHQLNVRSSEEIAERCNISMAAAQIRFERLTAIRQRDERFQQTTGLGCFMLSPLESQVLDQFDGFIEMHRN